jgi:hypothetical protein
LKRAKLNLKINANQTFYKFIDAFKSLKDKFALSSLQREASRNIAKQFVNG